MSDRRDVVYLYDGSFDGLLTAIFESYDHREIPVSIIENLNIQQDFLYTYVTIITNEEKSERVSNSIRKKFLIRLGAISIIHSFPTHRIRAVCVWLRACRIPFRRRG